MIHIIFVIVAGFSICAKDMEEYKAESRFLILRIVPGDKSAKLYLAGKKSAELSLQKDTQLLSVTAFDDSKKTETLKFSGEGDQYIIENLPQWKKPYQIKVKAQVKGLPEELHVKVGNQKP